MAVSLPAGRLDGPRRSRFGRRTRLPGATPTRARNSAAVDSVMLGVCMGLALLATLLPSPVRDRTAASLRRTAAAPLAILEQWSELHRAAFLSYDERVAARGTVVRDAQEAAALRGENARLRQLLGLGARLQWGFVTAEAVPNQQAGELGAAQTLQEFKVTVGSRAGVALFTPVVAPAGLVGMVQQVDPVRSQVISYAHPDFRVSAQADSAYGIVQPHLGAGAERGLLELHGVAFRIVLKPGQSVYSSGLGGTYPAGIPIGTVIREIQTPERWARTYLLQPAVNLAEVGPVLLLLRSRADRGLDSVWASPNAVEVNARRVAAAGDSIARDELLREAAARRAALDSARGDSARAPGSDSAAAPRAESRRGAEPSLADSGAGSGAASAGAPSAPSAAAGAIAPTRAKLPHATVPTPTRRDTSVARVRARADTAAPHARAARTAPRALEGADGTAGSAAVTPRSASPRPVTARSDSGARRPPRPTVPAPGATARPAGATRPTPRL